MDGNQIAEGLNKTLNQHYFTEEYRTNENGTGYAGIASGKINNIDVNIKVSIYFGTIKFGCSSIYLSFLGSYSSVTFRLKLFRKLDFHLLRTYLPSALFVLIAWFSMFVPLNHVPGK